jgi:ribonuclease BN (tRNA processing enzyme)
MPVDGRQSGIEMLYASETNGPMYIKCLGSGDAFGSGARFNTSFYLRTKSTGVLLDCGSSTLIALKRERLSADDIDIILITHLHGDHFGGLAFVLCEILALGKRKKTLTIVGPDETRKRTLQSLECFYPGVELTEDAPIRFIHYKAGETKDVGDLRLTAYNAKHSPETNPHSLRIETSNRVIAYSGDTEWTEDLIAVSEGADLFICEASGYRRPMKNHLTVAKIAEEQKKLRAKRIVLTHPGDEVLKHLDDIDLKVAGDGEILMNDDGG